MESTKMISYVGMERCDLIVYLINILRTKKIRTLVIDNSITKDLFLSLKRADEDADYVENGRVIFMRNKRVEEEKTGALEKFDIVLVYHGLNVNKDMTAMSDRIVLQTDYLPQHICEITQNMDMKWLNECPKEKLYLVYRDKTSGKVAEAQIKRMLGLTSVENEQTILYDEGNYNSYLNYCYNGSQETKGITSEMKLIVTTTKNWLFEENKKKRGGKK